jgi:hypothetical protein
MNNFHSNFPALMSDGRSFSNWQPTAVLNDQIRTRENLKTNWSYRQYLQNNADSIIAFDQSTACQQTGCPYAYVERHTPFPSDLKDSFAINQSRNQKDALLVNQLPLDA